METITFIPGFNKVKRSVGRKKLYGREFSLISDINLILELVIRNTLKFNKLTSADEIFNTIALVKNERISGIESELDSGAISMINLCNALSENNGILLKFEKNGEIYFKLNFNETV
jgi:hypothetical protein